MVFERSDKCMVLAPGPVVRVEGKPGCFWDPGSSRRAKKARIGVWFF